MGTISVSGLNENSVQGDRFSSVAFDALDGENAEIDLKDCPDLCADTVFLTPHIKTAESSQTQGG
ncbi:MAG: hypothetical protein L6V85_04685 [Clostridiales bacterium]|nr:MAG: hypothetical protein L6V85_04685 [Clostridiales bacterium]